MKNKPTIRYSKSSLLVVIAGLMITCYLAANVMATQIIQIDNVSIFDAGTIIFPVTYMLGEVVTELWGFRTARRLIFLTLGCQLLFTLFAYIAVVIPTPAETDALHQAYTQIFGFVPRIMLASVTAFTVGEMTNAWIMDRMKQRFAGPMWTRTISSSAIGYIMNTSIFVCIAFWGIVSARQLLTMIVFQVIAKIGIEICCSTPMAYASVSWIRRHLRENTQK